MTKANIFKTIGTAAMAMLFTACTSMVEIPERENYAQPKWYAQCAQSGTEGWFWWEEDYAYACGAGESRYQQAAEEQMYAVALNNFAKRVNGKVNSKTEIKFVNDVRTTETIISYNVTDTSITQHLQEERGTYIYAGKHFTFVKLSMPKAVFDQILAENKSN